MTDDWDAKISYLDKIIRPELEQAFKRGDQKYKDIEQHPVIRKRTQAEDIKTLFERQISSCLREAEDFAEMGDTDGALRKIESAIGHMVILHRRVRQKRSESETRTVVGAKDGNKKDKRLF